MKFVKPLAKALLPKRFRGPLGELIQPLKYVGNRFTCPSCGWHFRKFLPYGVEQRPNALCPKCGSLERHRLLWLYFNNRTNLFSDRLKVLHFAPEAVFQRAFVSLLNLEYTSADLDSPTAMTKMDVTAIPCKDESFDVVLCNHVLEHVYDDRRAIREIFRVLKPGGWAILQSPVDIGRDKTFEDPRVVLPEQRELIFGQYDHVRIYGLDYKDRLEEAGFTVQVDGYVRELGPDMVQRYALTEDEDIYFCVKGNIT